MVTRPKRAEGHGLTVLPTPPRARYRAARLDTAAGVRVEMAKLYRQARLGQIDVGDAARLAYLLTSIVKVMAEQEFDERLRRLEARNGDGPTGNATRSS